MMACDVGRYLYEMVYIFLSIIKRHENIISILQQVMKYNVNNMVIMNIINDLSNMKCVCEMVMSEKTDLKICT